MHILEPEYAFFRLILSDVDFSRASTAWLPSAAAASWTPASEGNLTDGLELNWT
jgi:hypothetical protein